MLRNHVALSVILRIAVPLSVIPRIAVALSVILRIAVALPVILRIPVVLSADPAVHDAHSRLHDVLLDIDKPGGSSR